MSAELPGWVARLAALGVVDPLDVRFAAALERRSASPEVALAAALASRAPTWGHVCAPLGDALETVAQEHAARTGQTVEATRAAIARDCPPWPREDAWAAALRESAVVDGPLTADGARPLVLFDGAVYLQRFWSLQLQLVRSVQARLGRWVRDVDVERLRVDLARLFPRPAVGVIEGAPEEGAPEEGAPEDRQRLAALLGATRALTIIVGGPGTGKTTTVVRLLGLVLGQAWALSQRGQGVWPPRIALAAPTGKAAARLTESLAAARGADALSLEPALLDAIPARAQTLHRLFGARPGRVGLRYTAEDPLPVDLLVVDEASMVDLPLMARVLDAVPPRARLVLLGDRDQIASVEAGAVLGDICAAGGGRWSRPLVEALGRLGEVVPAGLLGGGARPGVGDATVELDRAWRFDAAGGVARLGAAIREGEVEAALAVLADPSVPEVALWPAEPADDAPARCPDWLETMVAPFVAAALGADPQNSLTCIAEARVLCAHRRGRGGVDAWNERITRLVRARLAEAKCAAVSDWYPGRPLMVTTNDPITGLLNGDVGVVAAAPGGGWSLVFPGNGDAALRAVAPGRLPPHEPVYAMTMHKAQGSEFGAVLIALPERPTPLLTRELLYTAVTRARERVVVVGDAAVLRAAIATRSVRASGVRALLSATDEGESP